MFMKSRGLKETNKWNRVAFFGHFDSTNFGNESTLQTILYQIRCFQPDAEFTCISTGPEATTRAHKIKAIPIAKRPFSSWYPRNPLIRLARRICVDIPNELYQWVTNLVRFRGTDVLIIPGTGLLTDAYGLRAWGPYNLFKWSVIAKVTRCKLLFVGVGAGPICSPLGRWFIKSALSLADFRSYRDYSSLQYLKSIGFNADNDRICPDLVFSLSETLIPHQVTTKDGRPFVGLGLMGYAGPYSGEQSNQTYLAYSEKLVTVAKWLLQRQYDIRLLIGDLGDKHLMREFKDLLRGRLSVYDEDRIIDVPPSSVEDLLSQIAATDLVVATRFHNVLFALLCNKPVISISFHHKCDSLMSAMGLSSYCLEMSDLESDSLIEKFCELEQNSHELKYLIRDRVEECRKALDLHYKFIFDEVQ
jgi:polysaccharide pyruvyl transferase WcaK-like protein